MTALAPMCWRMASSRAVGCAVGVGPPDADAVGTAVCADAVGTWVATEVCPPAIACAGVCAGAETGLSSVGAGVAVSIGVAVGAACVAGIVALGVVGAV